MARFQYKPAPHINLSRRLFFSLAVFALILCVFIFGIHKLSRGNISREKENLENALSRAITYCYATEGVYPENFEYLKRTYGITYNEDLFFVDYRTLGGNLRPDVTVIERGTD